MVAKALRDTRRVFTCNTAKKRCASSGRTVSRQHAKTRGDNAVGSLKKTRVFRVRTGFLRVFMPCFMPCRVFSPHVKNSAAKCRTMRQECRTLRHIRKPAQTASGRRFCVFVMSFSAALASRARTAGAAECGKTCRASGRPQSASGTKFHAVSIVLGPPSSAAANAPGAVIGSIDRAHSTTWRPDRCLDDKLM